jgi:hypothetical protein
MYFILLENKSYSLIIDVGLKAEEIAEETTKAYL